MCKQKQFKLIILRHIRCTLLDFFDTNIQTVNFSIAFMSVGINGVLEKNTFSIPAEILPKLFKTPLTIGFCAHLKKNLNSRLFYFYRTLHRFLFERSSAGTC